MIWGAELIVAALAIALAWRHLPRALLDYPNAPPGNASSLQHRPGSA